MNENLQDLPEDVLRLPATSEASVELPVYPGLWNHRPVTWAARPTSPEAKALCWALSAELGLDYPEPGADTATKPRKRGRPPKMTEGQVLEAFVGDLLLHARHGEWSMHPTSPVFFTGAPLGSDIFQAVRGALRRAEFIEEKPGYRLPDGLTVSTKYRPTATLFRMALEHGVSWRQARKHFSRTEDAGQKARPTVEIRSRFGDEVMPVPDTQAARLTSAQVAGFNAFVAGFQIESGAPGCRDVHRPVFQRVFTESLDYHGRLYDRSPSYQHLPKPDSTRYPWAETRASMTINGEPVIELDVHASSLTILHGMAGMPLPDREDLYALPGINRETGKTWLKQYLGSGGQTPVRWARDEDPEQFNGLKPTHARTALLEAYPFLDDPSALLGVPTRMELTWHAFAAIEARAVLGAAFRLQGEGILALPLHDGIIVQERHQKRAREALVAGYRAEAGITPVIRVKRGVEGA
ncbi:hypothetical protein [Falsiroseomonas sp. HW251]|uniref:hypothetical protein n=1 Tax=Falsiroseomonas sp. HW251 TaxID=3390998 RepID=UPI003D32348E